MGRSIYFTDKELKQLRNYALEAIEILGEASETAEQTDNDLDDGLGSAMRKLYKGYNGEARFAKYKTKRQWKIAFKVGENKNYSNLLKEKGFILNTYPEGKFWELVITKDENKKEHICKVFEADIELFDSNTTDIDTLILQCAEDFTKCLFYYDCNPFDMETKTFMKCVENM